MQHVQHCPKGTSTCLPKEVGLWLVKADYYKIRGQLGACFGKPYNL